MSLVRFRLWAPLNSTKSTRYASHSFWCLRRTVIAQFWLRWCGWNHCGQHSVWGCCWDSVFATVCLLCRCRAERERLRAERVDFHPERRRLGGKFSLRTEPCEPFPKAVSGGGNGVIHMGLLNIIRRIHLRQKLSIREIALQKVIHRGLGKDPSQSPCRTKIRPNTRCF